MYIIAAYLLIALSVLLLARKTVQLEKEEERNRLIQSYMVTLQGFYQTIQEQIDMTRKFRHDLAKHIQTLEVLMAEEDRAELQKYADGLKLEYRRVENKGESESEVVNAILSMKRKQCQEKGISLYLNIEEKGYSLVRDMDMVGILVNLLDNAIEENEKIESEEQRGIWLDMKEKEQGEVWLQIKNKIRPDKKINFQTEKKGEHGIGRGIIEYLVKQYQGEEKVSIDQKTSVFCETILLKCRIQEDESK